MPLAAAGEGDAASQSVSASGAFSQAGLRRVVVKKLDRVKTEPADVSGSCHRLLLSFMFSLIN